MVMPRSRSIGLLSSTCEAISRSVRPPQSWMMRSASVDLPWSTWAMIEKFRMCCMLDQRPDGGENAALSHGPGGFRGGCPPRAPVPASAQHEADETGAAGIANDQADFVAGRAALRGLAELGERKTVVSG